MEMIVLVDRNWGIGANGDLLVRIKRDLQHFREFTEDAIVVYGRKTLDTFPGGRVLPERENWVLTSQQATGDEPYRVFNTLEALLAAGKAAELQGRRVIVIGGASVYEQLLPYTSDVEVTKVNYEWPEADVFFHNMDEDKTFSLRHVSEQYEAGKTTTYTYTFNHYVRRMATED